MITAKNIIKHELIGLEAEVVESDNESLVGIKGHVIDETKNMVVIEQDGKEKSIPKKGSKFIFTLPDGSKVKVDGDIISSRPEERTKNKLKKW